MKRFHLVCWVMIVAAALALGGCKKSGPVAQIEAPAFDFGTADQDTQVNHTYVLKNLGDQPLEISRTRSTCGCTVANPTKMKLAPGETSNIEVTFSTGHRSGKQEKHITVETNDTKNPKTSLVLTGEVIERMKFDPNRMYFEDLQPGKEVSKDVTVTNNAKDPMTITEIKPAEGDPLTVKMAGEGKKELPITLKPTESLTFTVTLTLPADKQFFHSRLDLLTQGADAKPVTYYVSGRVKNAPGLAANPASAGTAQVAPMPAGVGRIQKVIKPEDKGKSDK